MKMKTYLAVCLCFTYAVFADAQGYKFASGNEDPYGSGGINALPQQVPHMALLGYGGNHLNISELSWQCGGSLIDSRFVITAGHCTTDPEGLDVSHVALGVLRRSDIVPSKVYTVKKIHKHPDYKTALKYNDIAIIELNNSVTRQKPACLDTGADYIEVIASGWGPLQHLLDSLQLVSLKKFKDAVCTPPPEIADTLPQGIDLGTQVCYGDTKGNACQGDSGGPLQVVNQWDGNCTYVIVGVTSFGKVCGKPDEPGVYTRVAPYLPWITTILHPEGQGLLIKLLTSTRSNFSHGLKGENDTRIDTEVFQVNGTTSNALPLKISEELREPDEASVDVRFL